VIKWVKTQEDKALTQETGPGMYAAREVLIQLLSVNGLKGGRWKTCEKGEQDCLGKQAFGSLKKKNSEAKILLVQSFKELKGDSTGSSNSKLFPALGKSQEPIRNNVTITVIQPTSSYNSHNSTGSSNSELF
jgi:hypothetical protein